MGSAATPKNRLGSDTGCGHNISCPKHGLQVEQRRSDLLRDGNPNSGYISLKTKRTARQTRTFLIVVVRQKYVQNDRLSCMNLLNVGDYEGLL